jgi:hypothetical protein
VSFKPHQTSELVSLFSQVETGNLFSAAIHKKIRCTLSLELCRNNLPFGGFGLKRAGAISILNHSDDTMSNTTGVICFTVGTMDLTVPI